MFSIWKVFYKVAFQLSYVEFFGDLTSPQCVVILPLPTLCHVKIDHSPIGLQ